MAKKERVGINMTRKEIREFMVKHDIKPASAEQKKRSSEFADLLVSNLNRVASEEGPSAKG